MSYIGNQPFTAAFITDQFSGNGSTTAFTLSAAPATTSSILVAISGVLQDPSTYSVSGTTLTFSPAPPAGTGNISVRFLGIPASGVTTTAYRTVTDFTATAGQTTFSPPSYTAGYIDVYRNGVKLGAADFTATNGTTVVLANACTAGDLVQTVSFFVSSVLGAMSPVGGTFTGSVQFASGNGVWDSAGNVGVGTASPNIYSTNGRLLTVSNSSNYSFLTLAGSSGNGGAIDFGNQTIRHAEIASLDGSALAFYTNGTNSGTGLSERGRFTSGGDFQFNSGYGSVATAYGCRAWVNFNGTGTVAIRASGNVSSITDNGTGDYTVNFTNAMPDANYTAVANCDTNPSFSVQFVSMFVSAVSNSTVAPTTSGFRLSTRESNGSGRDETYVTVAVFR